MLGHHESAWFLMLAPDRLAAVRSTGTILCLVSAAAFGAMAVFGKLAYEEGATVGTLLAVRFTLAAALFWAILAVRGHFGELRRLSRRDLATGLALGGVGYAAQAGCYFSALERIDASLLSLVLYTFPAMVTAAAIVLGRETLVCTGAAVSLVTGSAVLGELRPGALTSAGWGWLGSLAIVSTVVAIGLFFAGLRRLGPTGASILSTLEPVVTVLLAFLVFGETLTAVQVLGGALVIAAVPVLALAGREGSAGRRVHGSERAISAPASARSLT
jgi:drug/metabolite transporter (DMT)-like permease